FIVNVKLGDNILKVKTLKEIKANSGDPVYLKFDWRAVSVFDESSGSLLKELSKIIRERYS
ncbi:MAG: hypothetical protein QW081_05870, partial [Desulfurococcaceae archaeon]